MTIIWEATFHLIRDVSVGHEQLFKITCWITYKDGK